MASFEFAYNFTAGNEDSLQQFKNVPDPVPVKSNDSPAIAEAKRAARAISGINSFYWPKEFAVINAIPQAERGPSVKQFYKVHFWNQWIEQLISDRLAARIYDSGVNQGVGVATEMLQEACNNVSGLSLRIDGDWGPQTLQAANNCNPDMLCEAFRVLRVKRYENSPVSETTKRLLIARANK